MKTPHTSHRSLFTTLHAARLAFVAWCCMPLGASQLNEGPAGSHPFSVNTFEPNSAIVPEDYMIRSDNDEEPMTFEGPSNYVEKQKCANKILNKYPNIYHVEVKDIRKNERGQTFDLSLITKRKVGANIEVVFEKKKIFGRDLYVSKIKIHNNNKARLSLYDGGKCVLQFDAESSRWFYDIYLRIKVTFYNDKDIPLTQVQALDVLVPHWSARKRYHTTLYIPFDLVGQVNSFELNVQ